MAEDAKVHEEEQDAVRRSGLLYAILAIIILILMGVLRTGCVDGGGNTAVVAPTLDAPPSTIPNGSYILSGTGQPETDVQLTVDGDELTVVPVSGAGKWIYPTSFDAGTYQVQANALNSNGDVADSSVVSFFRVFQTYDVPTLTMPGEDADPGSVTFAGTGTPGSTVELFNNGESLGTVVVGEDGTWSLETAVSGYSNEFEAIAYQPDGTEIGSSGLFPWLWPAAAAALTIDAPELGELSLGGNGLPTGSLSLSGTGEPNSALNLFVNNQPLGKVDIGADGTWSFEDTIELAPGDYDVNGTMTAIEYADLGFASAGSLNIPVLGSVSLDTAMAANDGTMQLAGTAPPGFGVNIWVNGEVVDTVTADADGNWSWESGTPFTAGDYELQAQLADLPDIVSDTMSAQIRTFVALNTPETNLLDDGTSDVTISGTTLPGNRVEIFSDGQYVGEAVADETGAWSFDFNLPDGAYTITARAIGLDGSRQAEAAVRAVVGEEIGGLSLVYGGTSDLDGASVESGEFTAVSIEGTPAVEIILDASWSMIQEIDNTTRFDIAQEALTNIAGEILPEGTPTALRIFGNIEGNLACRTDLMVPYGPLDREAFNEVVANAAPQVDANTAIAASLLEVVNDLADAAEEERIVVLLTDGEETCEGDPAAAIQQLVDAGFNVQVNIVGLAIAEQTLKDEFTRWATIGGGQYYDVDNPGQLIDAMRVATGAEYTVIDESGAVVATSRVGGPTVDLEPGTYTIEIRTDPATVIEEVTIAEGEVLRLVLR